MALLVFSLKNLDIKYVYMKKLNYFLKNLFCTMRFLMVLNKFRLATEFGKNSYFSFQTS